MIAPMTRGEGSGADPTASLPSAPDPLLLSPREVEILQALANGAGPREVSVLLDIKLPTVKAHIQNIHRKLDVSSTLLAVVKAMRDGWIR